MQVKKKSCKALHNKSTQQKTLDKQDTNKSNKIKCIKHSFKKGKTSVKKAVKYIVSE